MPSPALLAAAALATASAFPVFVPMLPNGAAVPGACIRCHSCCAAWLKSLLHLALQHTLHSSTTHCRLCCPWPRQPLGRWPQQYLWLLLLELQRCVACPELAYCPELALRCVVVALLLTHASSFTSCSTCAPAVSTYGWNAVSATPLATRPHLPACAHPLL